MSTCDQWHTIWLKSTSMHLLHVIREGVGCGETHGASIFGALESETWQHKILPTYTAMLQWKVFLDTSMLEEAGYMHNNTLVLVFVVVKGSFEHLPYITKTPPLNKGLLEMCTSSHTHAMFLGFLKLLNICTTFNFPKHLSSKSDSLCQSVLIIHTQFNARFRNFWLWLRPTLRNKKILFCASKLLYSRVVEAGKLCPLTLLLAYCNDVLLRSLTGIIPNNRAITRKKPQKFQIAVHNLLFPKYTLSLTCYNLICIFKLATHVVVYEKSYPSSLTKYFRWKAVAKRKHMIFLCRIDVLNIREHADNERQNCSNLMEKLVKGKSHWPFERKSPRSLVLYSVPRLSDGLTVHQPINIPWWATFTCCFK